jgi:hypothetical protein
MSRSTTSTAQIAYGGPRITNDGVSIAKEISFKDRFENMGAEIVKEVANKTNDGAGDGTTTTVVLLEALVNEGLSHMNKGANAMAIRSGMEKAKTQAVEELRKMAKKVSGKAEIKQVASISAESDELGSIIADTVGNIERDGLVVVAIIPLPEKVDGAQILKALEAYFNLMSALDADGGRIFIRELLTRVWLAARRMSVPLHPNLYLL